MQIFLKHIDGKTLILNVNEHDTIFDVKNKIFNHPYIKIPVEYQRLSYQSKELLNNRTLFDYNIQEHYTIHLMLRLLSCDKCNR